MADQESGTELAVRTETSVDLDAAFKQAIAMGEAGVKALETLVNLKIRVEDRQAASEFTAAMLEFQKRCPSIQKKKTASFLTKGGSTFNYNYADLPEICRTVNPLLYPLGLSYKWDSEVSPDGSRIKVTCTVTHVAGHKVTASFEAPVDKGTGTSAAQDYQKLRTYGERNSLIQALGIFSADPDTDAAPGNAVSDKQLADLEDMMRAVGQDRLRFLKLLKVEKLGDLPAANFEIAMNLLRAKLPK